ncbi:MAG: MotA/TolQ/ExbB proton channel family protein, partial [Verrucomicrobiota bacterium]
IERLLHYRRATIDSQQLLKGLSNLVGKRKYGEALQNCSGIEAPVARVLQAALLRRDQPRNHLRDVVQEAGQLEVPRLERSLNILLTVAYMAPLIGFLGTMISLLDAFVVMDADTGFANSRQMVEAIYTSLISSAFGLAVAIPAYILYAYLASRVKSLMHEMERAGIEMINLIEDSRVEGEILSFARGQSVSQESNTGE